MIEPLVTAGLVEAALAKMKWVVRKREESETGSGRHDLVVTDPNGKVFLIELKGGEEPMHFGTIAQVERSARLLSETEGGTVTPVLLTSQNVRASLSELADEVGVRVVEATGSDHEAAESVVQFLQAVR